MIGEECKFLHPAPCRKYMENHERSLRAQCKGCHPELCKYSRATRECYNDRCFRIHLKGTRRMQTKPATQDPRTTPLTTNQQQALIKPQNLAHNRPLPLLTLPTQHTTATQPAPSPTHYLTPPATQYLTTHQTTVPLYPNPPPLHAIPNTTSHPQPLLNPFIVLKHPHSHHKHIIQLFPTSSSHLNPTPHTSIPRMGTSERHKGEQLRMTIFFYGN